MMQVGTPIGKQTEVGQQVGIKVGNWLVIKVRRQPRPTGKQVENQVGMYKTVCNYMQRLYRPLVYIFKVKFNIQYVP